MKYLVAVSGGIDSVVLLHQLVSAGEHELIVAHFDHGIRPDSAADARFVAGLALAYQLPYVGQREELGGGASEELARQRRYRFLRDTAREHQATLVTAHHADDVVETVAINVSRGTGWRGLAVLNAPDIIRPLLHISKQALRDYALSHRLEWVEDSTNATTDYLRNRVRRVIALRMTNEQQRAIGEQRLRQVELSAQIDHQTAQFVTSTARYDRYLLTQLDMTTARELLRAIVVAAGASSPTRPQLERGVLAIKTAKPRTVYELGSQVYLRFETRSFIVETTEKMLLL